MEKNPNTSIFDVFASLKTIINLLQRPLWVSRNTGNLRSEVVSGTITTVSTVTAVTSVNGFGATTSLNNFSGFPIRETLMYPIQRSNYGLNVRMRIA